MVTIVRDSPSSIFGRSVSKVFATLALAVVLTVFSGTLVSLAPEPAEDVVAEASGGLLVDAKAAAGNWHWGTYRFNYWETREIGRWTPWGCGSSCWGASLVLGLGRLSPAGWLFYAFMWSYRAQANSALRQGKCLNIAFHGLSSWPGPCGR